MKWRPPQHLPLTGTTSIFHTADITLIIEGGVCLVVSKGFLFVVVCQAQIWGFQTHHTDHSARW